MADSDIIGRGNGFELQRYPGVAGNIRDHGIFFQDLIAPGYAQNADVASALVSLADTVRAVALIDSPPSTSPATAIANRGSRIMRSTPVLLERFSAIRRRLFTTPAWCRQGLRLMGRPSHRRLPI